MKYLGIDYCSKKFGFENSYEEGKFAFPLMIAPNDKQLLKDTVELIREMKITHLVVGESVDPAGKLNPIAKEARSFAMALERMVDVQIAFEREWYSTVEARKQPGKEGSHEVDDQAAAIVLQRHLDKINGPGVAADEYESEDDVDEERNSDNW
jgi:putative transcription antitermination factor YqgF